MTTKHRPYPSRGHATPPQPGFHPVEWLCELLGTAIVLLVGISAICFDFGTSSPLRALPMSTRLLLTGLIFAGTGSLVAISPLGRRSGAHLNPVVTLAFWTQRKVHWHDLVGYLVSQFAGAILGTLAAHVLWRNQAASVSDGATTPGPGVPDFLAVAVEAGMTACLLLTILFMTSHHRIARFTPLLLWVLIAVFVWQLAPLTGTSMNPARSLGPALIAPSVGTYWIYVLGPLLGAAAAVALFSLAQRTEVLTTKLFHDPRYRSTMGTTLPAAGHH
ncbi:aquaporin Z [Frondihabitans sp. PhB188]|uniref:MIP/aquaporin family protein n=1 Tax=Frondihabitans sp. PhB188 TaxID=2485200 RepID=UPI000F46484B|nr:MIP/aquaporin family protein [Frondihabitans sp. PhB188]ROQ30899.1 aquaporin Z [Frondihabitans sp. PhB188]